MGAVGQMLVVFHIKRFELIDRYVFQKTVTTDLEDICRMALNGCHWINSIPSPPPLTGSSTVEREDLLIPRAVVVIDSDGTIPIVPPV